MIDLPDRNESRRLINWIRVSDFEWKAGNVRIRCCIKPNDLGSWFVQVKYRHRWRWAYVASRPYGYGSAGQAKRGIPKWRDVLFYDQPPAEPMQ